MILLYTLSSIGFSLALPLAFRFLIDNILGQRPLQEWVPFVGSTGHVIATGEEQLATLVRLTALLGLFYLLNAVARIGLATRVNALGEAFVLDLRRQMVGILARLPAAYFARTTTADVNQRVVHDTATLQRAVVGALIPLVASLLTAGLYASVLLTLQPRLALFAALGLPLLALLHRMRRRNLGVAARERVRRLSALSAGVSELAAAQVLVKLYSAAPYLLNHLGLRLEMHSQLNVAYARESSMVGQTATLVVHLIQVGVLLVGGYIVVASNGQELGPGGLAAFYVLLSQLFGPVNQIASTRQSLTDASASLERVSELLGQAAEQDPSDGVELEPPRRAIRFESVSFVYRPEGRSVLKSLTLAIPSGATVAFVGPTGAGKSSLVHLLTRLHDPTRGTVTWDGVDVRLAKLSSLRRQVGLVPQDSFLLNASVYENVRFGQEDVTEADVERTADSRIHVRLTASRLNDLADAQLRDSARSTDEWPIEAGQRVVCRDGDVGPLVLVRVEPSTRPPRRGGQGPIAHFPQGTARRGRPRGAGVRPRQRDGGDGRRARDARQLVRPAARGRAARTAIGPGLALLRHRAAGDLQHRPAQHGDGVPPALRHGPSGNRPAHPWRDARQAADAVGRHCLYHTARFWARLDRRPRRSGEHDGVPAAAWRRRRSTCA